jgi:gamma-glutamyltranspeptidase/glutathione hydrolase
LTLQVPGAAAAWVDIIEKFGSLPLAEVLGPAIELAEKGYPVSPITASHWARGVEQLRQGGPYGGDMLIDGRAPRAGEVIKMPKLAK